MPSHNWMNLRISVEKSCDSKGEKFVSVYFKRSKKNLKKSYFASTYLRIWYDFWPQQKAATAG